MRIRDRVFSDAIRLATTADAAAIAAIYHPIVERTAISFETEAPDPDTIARRIAETVPSYPWLVCDEGSRILGYAYASRHRQRAAYRWSVDTSVYVDAEYRRRGVATGLYRLLLRVLAAQGFFNAFAGIALPNAGSVTLHESLGFRPIGVYHKVGYKLGAWHDVGWWQLELNEPVDGPFEPLDLWALRERGDWPLVPSA